MTNFIGVYGQRHNLASVRKVTFFNNGSATVTYHNGDEDDLTAAEDKDLIESFRAAAQEQCQVDTVPATPGFEIVAFWADADGDPETFDIAAKLYRTPVIAWKIPHEEKGFDVSVTAVGIDLNSDQDLGKDGCRCTTLAPDGRVRSYWGECFDTLEDWVELVREQWKEKKRRAVLKVVGQEVENATE